MKVYAIRELATGFYMPARQPSKSSKGFTSDEPKENGGKWGPRLFFSYKGAHNSLVAWAQGVWMLQWQSGYDIFDDVRDLTIQARPNRSRQNMEIVEFNLQEISRNI